MTCDDRGDHLFILTFKIAPSILHQHAHIVEYEIARKRLRDTQYELSSTRTELERKIISLEQAARESDILKKKLMSRVDSLESDRRFLYEQEKHLTTKYETLEGSSLEFKTSSNEIIKSVREENMELKERLSTLREESRATESRLSHQIRTLTASLTYQEQTLVQSKDSNQTQTSLVEQKHQQLLESLTKIQELEDENRQLRQNTKGLEDVSRIERELKSQVAYIKQLEGTNRQLVNECKHYKEMYRNVEVLKEEKAGMEQKLKMMDDLRIKCGKLEVQNGTMQKEKQQWMAFLRPSDSTGFNSPHELTKTIASLRGENVALLEMKGNYEAAVKSRDAYIEKLEEQAFETRKAIAEQEDLYHQQLSLARQHERSKDLALRQIESLKAQLKSYDTEEAQLMGGNYDTQKNARIEELEKLVQEYHDKLEQVASSSIHSGSSFGSSMEVSPAAQLLQTIQNDAQSSFKQLNTEKQALFEAKLRLEQEVDLLRKENASLDAKVLEHEIAIGAGAFNPATSRILEIKDSPANRYQAVRQQMLDSLTKENEELLQLVAQLQKHSMGQTEKMFQDETNEMELKDDDIVPAATFNRLKGDHSRLVTELAENSKRVKRLKESWTEKADEFLQAIRSLLGYRINFLDNGRVELISVYNTELQQSFVFTSGVNDEGTMQLVGSGSQQYMDEHQESFDHWVNRLGSIPAFLSRVTLDQVAKQYQEQLQRQSSQEHSGQQPLQPPQPPQPFQLRYLNPEDDLTQSSDMVMDV
ncbi:coiled-coil domain-containing protein mad1 [Lunasporangiospora selenospora]|uniref:Spindle assembly checkpoint component MAD1 n=1 Tax=Lunasporangiospora selenospora TaxID=979761 RepID=A0A9P6KHZ4_9FUNG|nr:coiled-coil domain-containing protein mad1 [Lunasporangiospora selenospora]